MVPINRLALAIFVILRPVTTAPAWLEPHLQPTRGLEMTSRHGKRGIPYSSHEPRARNKHNHRKRSNL